jgi:hypothetical protein
MTTMASTKDKNRTENVETAQSIDHATERNISKVMEIECAQRQNRTVGRGSPKLLPAFAAA